jgi:hypothetical protein
VIYLNLRQVTIVDYDPSAGEITCQTTPDSAYIWCRIGHLIADGGTREINDRLAEIMRENEDGQACAI